MANQYRNKHPTTALPDLNTLEVRKLMNKVQYGEPEPVDQKPLDAPRVKRDIYQYEREVAMRIFGGFVIIAGFIFFAAGFPIPAILLGVVGLIAVVAG